MRFDKLKTYLSRTSSLAHPDFEPAPQIVDSKTFQKLNTDFRGPNRYF